MSMFGFFRLVLGFFITGLCCRVVFAGNQYLNVDPRHISKVCTSKHESFCHAGTFGLKKASFRFFNSYGFNGFLYKFYVAVH